MGRSKLGLSKRKLSMHEGITFSYDERVEKGHHRTEKK